MSNICVFGDVVITTMKFRCRFRFMLWVMENLEKY